MPPGRRKRGRLRVRWLKGMWDEMIKRGVEG
jgi:hypothetical protein